MKVTISVQEITALVREKYGLPFDMVLEISDLTISDAAKNLVNTLKIRDCLTEFGNIAPDKKIAAIKTLRELVGNCGLAQAKYAIEDWPCFLDSIRKNGYPPMSPDDPPYGWKSPVGQPYHSTT